MNQEKIGKFILKLRKEKNMTQQELADKLLVSDKTISKWENGRGMPDLSLMKPLCEVLDISINELLSGERLEKDNYQEKFEENILNTINYAGKKIKNNNKIFRIVIIIIVLITPLFAVDILCIYNIERPLFGVKTANSNVYKGVFYDTYVCEDYSVPAIKLKGTKFNCPTAIEAGDTIVEIIDKSKNDKNFTCDYILNYFYKDYNYTYYFECTKNNYVIVKFKNGIEVTVSDALNNGYITIDDLDNYNIDYIKYENN